MKSIYAAAVCFLAAAVSAAPAQQIAPYPIIQARQSSNTTTTTTTTTTTPPPPPATPTPAPPPPNTVNVAFSGNASCQGSSALISNSWGVYFPGNTLGAATDANGLGGGLLDNLRGRCGDITGWNPGTDAAGTGLGATFSTDDFCTAFDVTQAILAATGGANVPTNVPCTFNGDLSVQLEGAAEVIDAVGDFIKNAWSIISLFFESAE